MGEIDSKNATFQNNVDIGNIYQKRIVTNFSPELHRPKKLRKKHQHSPIEDRNKMHHSFSRPLKQNQYAMNEYLPLDNNNLPNIPGLT